jgi:hypothetical protein
MQVSNPSVGAKQDDGNYALRMRDGVLDCLRPARAVPPNHHPLMTAGVDDGGKVQDRRARPEID